MPDLTTYDVTLHDVEASVDANSCTITIPQLLGGAVPVRVDIARVTVTPKYDLQPGDIWQAHDGDLGQLSTDGQHWLVLTPHSSRYDDLVDDTWMTRPLKPVYTPRAGRVTPEPDPA